MPEIFNLPKVTVLPGANLYFYQSGTSTPQNVYTDIGLTVAHSQPITADANGVVEPIYLDPTLSNYRFRMETADGVLIYQVDNIPSNQNVQQAMRLESILPTMFWYDTDGTANKRKYRAIATGDEWQLQSLNDAENSSTTHIAIKRDLQERVVINEAAYVLVDATEYPLAYVISSTFTGTLTGFASPPTGTVTYVKVGSLVTLSIPTAAAGFTGTSNSTAMTITGMPAVIRPTSTQYIVFPGVVDSGNLIGDGEQVIARIESSGVITFMINGSATGFTGSGTKSTSLGGTISYLTS